MKSSQFQDFYAAIPIYNENGGNITRLIKADGIIEEDKKISIWLRRLTETSRFNVNVLKQEAQQCFARKTLLPIPINPSCILLPIKVRKPIGANDGAYGYVSLDSIHLIEPAKDKEIRSRILFKDNTTSLLTMTNHEILNQQVAIAKIVRHQYFNFVTS